MAKKRRFTDEDTDQDFDVTPTNIDEKEKKDAAVSSADIDAFWEKPANQGDIQKILGDYGFSMKDMTYETKAALIKIILDRRG